MFQENKNNLVLRYGHSVYPMNFRQWLENSSNVNLNFYDGYNPISYLIDNKGNSHKVPTGETHNMLASKLTGRPIEPPVNTQWVSEPLSTLLREGWIRVYGNNFHVTSIGTTTKPRIASFLLELFGEKVFQSNNGITIEIGDKTGVNRKELFLIGEFVRENT